MFIVWYWAGGLVHVVWILRFNSGELKAELSSPTLATWFYLIGTPAHCVVVCPEGQTLIDWYSPSWKSYLIPRVFSLKTQLACTSKFRIYNGGCPVEPHISSLFEENLIHKCILSALPSCLLKKDPNISHAQALEQTNCVIAWYHSHGFSIRHYYQI